MHGILPCLFHPIGPPIVRQFTGKWFTSISDIFLFTSAFCGVKFLQSLSFTNGKFA